jgi:hypothetical protein
MCAISRWAAWTLRDATLGGMTRKRRLEFPGEIYHNSDTPQAHKSWQRTLVPRRPYGEAAKMAYGRTGRACCPDRLADCAFSPASRSAE